MNDIERNDLQLIIQVQQDDYSLERHRSRNLEEHTNEFIRVVESEFKNKVGALRFSKIEYEVHIRVVLASNEISKYLSN